MISPYIFDLGVLITSMFLSWHAVFYKYIYIKELVALSKFQGVCFTKLHPPDSKSESHWKGQQLSHKVIALNITERQKSGAECTDVTNFLQRQQLQTFKIKINFTLVWEHFLKGFIAIAPMV